MSSNTESWARGRQLMKSSWKGLILYEARHTISSPLSDKKPMFEQKKFNFYVARFSALPFCLVEKRL